MATAFTSQERECIYESLQNAALHCAATIGMKHTTVDELAGQAGISKGAFYSFFESKEHLFLSMAERLLDEMYGKAEKTFEERTDLPIRERAVQAVYALCQVAQQHEIVSFMKEELPLLLRKIPSKLLQEHRINDDERIRNLIEKTGVKLKTSVEVACTMVHMLLMTLTFQRDMGSHFDEAIRLMVEGACNSVFA